MPTYEYECNECRKRFELFQSMKDEPVKTCSHCGGEVRRLIGAGAGIIFKGSGFYVNDYKGSKAACSSSGTSETSSSSDSSDACSSCSMNESCSS